MQVSLAHVSVGCNRVVHAIDWGELGLVAYAAHNAVAIYKAEEATVVATLIGHTGRVNCVKWIPLSVTGVLGGSVECPVQALVSGSADNSLIVWLVHPDSASEPWRASGAKLQGHQGPVTGVAVHPLSDSSFLLISTAGDDDVLVWTCVPGAAGSEGPLSQSCWSIQQKISLPLHLQHSVAVAALPGQPDWLLLAMGGVDNSIRLLLAPPGGEFAQVCTLTGHGNWVRSLAFSSAPGQYGEKLLLASASQDKYARIWVIQQTFQGSPAQANGHVQPDSLAATISRYAPKAGFSAGEAAFTAVLEAVLIGHEDWVHSVAWQPQAAHEERPCLLSASMDRTMALWRPDAGTGLWMSEESVGDAGPSSLGYFGGVWGPDGRSILANGYTGALHLWQREEDSGSSRGSWIPQHALGGHFCAVVGLAWSFDGDCLLSISTDQTARIITANPAGHWFEIARPQVHGHDFSCVASLPQSSGKPYTYASGSEEKVIRVLEAPQAFLDTLAATHGRDAEAGTSSIHQGAEVALGASVAALGLSNKAVYASDSTPSSDNAGGYTEGPDMAPNAAPGAVAGPPLEEHLAQSTLWPEVYKVYGHGNELYCLAADPRGEFLASACRAQATEVAAVWLWNVANWHPVAQLPAHTLTVTQLSFSPNGSYLVSVSRDRSLAVWQRTEDAKTPYRLAVKVAKAHARIIWTVCCSADSSCFATGSRDNLVKLWSLDQASQEAPLKAFANLPSFSSSVQAVAFAPHVARSSQNMQRHWLAVGLEDGGIQILALDIGKASAGLGLEVVAQAVCWQAPNFMAHCAPVQSLCWRVGNSSEQFEIEAAKDIHMHLASGGADHAVRVFQIRVV